MLTKLKRYLNVGIAFIRRFKNARGKRSSNVWKKRFLNVRFGRCGDVYITFTLNVT